MAPLFLICLILSCPSKWIWGYRFLRMFCRPSGNRIQEITPFEGIYDLMYHIYLLLVPVSLVLTGGRILHHPCCVWSVLLFLPYPCQTALVLAKKSFGRELTGSVPRWEHCLLEPCGQVSVLHTGNFPLLTVYLQLTEEWHCLAKDLVFGGCGCDAAEHGQKGVWHTSLVDKQAACKETGALLSQSHSYGNGQETETDVSSPTKFGCEKSKLFLFFFKCQFLFP